MRAMFIKDIVILMFFLSSGLTVFTLMAFDMGFDQAFVVPQYRLPEELIGTWIGWGLVFGWAMGATDQLRGLTDYITHRGYSKARLFWTQHGLGVGVILVSLTTPWVLLALLGDGLYEPDYAGIGSPWLLASTVVFPCYAVGVFLANLPLHIVVRVGLTFPMIFWIVGEQPDRIFEIGMYQNPVGLAVKNALLGSCLLVAGYLGLKSNRDRDLPAPASAMLPALVLLVGVGWSLHALQTMAMMEFTKDIDRVHVSQRADGSFTLSKAQHDADSGKFTLWEVDADSHKPTIINEELTRVDLARRFRRRSAFSDGSRPHQTAGSGIAGNARRVSAYVSMQGKGILHLVERDIYNGTKLYLEKTNGPFSKSTRLFDPSQRNTRAVIWAGDPTDGTVWYADFSQDEWKYVALDLPDEDRFEAWLEPNPGIGFRIAKALSGHEPRDTTFRLAFMKTTGGIVYVNRDSKHVSRLTEEQLTEVEAMGSGPTVPLLYVSNPGLLFRESEVRTRDGEVLFAYGFYPKTLKQKWKATQTAFASVLSPPILAPKAFGNITHVQRYDAPDNSNDIDPLRDPIRFASMQALTYSRLHWTGFSAWSSIAWALLVVIALYVHKHFKHVGASGPRLWIWPLAVLAFGPCTLLAVWAFEPKRAHRHLERVASNKVPPLLIHSA
ncbi:MAG: hypothetical protein ACI87O_002616 [Planctomycetota bacterium]|jgi:hypothetical protein